MQNGVPMAAAPMGPPVVQSSRKSLLINTKHLVHPFLTEQGWMIVASGNITHNLHDWRRASGVMAIDTSCAERFSDWVAQQLDERNTEAMFDYRRQHPDAPQSQPRDEHFLPLFIALGAAGPEAYSRHAHRGIRDHVIVMDGYAFAQLSSACASQ